MRPALAILWMLVAASAQADAATTSKFVGGDALRGAQLYDSRCIACHSLDANGAGPRHRGIVGRRVASVADYLYSPALAGRTFIWTVARLDRWLADPNAYVPGNKMAVRLADDPQDRRDLIAFLAAQRPVADH